MKRFKSSEQAQRFFSVFESLNAPFDCAGIFSLQLVIGYCSNNLFIFGISADERLEAVS
jgi:hypothetical protein